LLAGVEDGDILDAVGLVDAYAYAAALDEEEVRTSLMQVPRAAEALLDLSAVERNEGISLDLERSSP